MSLMTSLMRAAKPALLPDSSRAPAGGYIGPNAVIRMAEALIALDNQAAARAVFEAAGLEHYLEAPPEKLVPEHEVTSLMAAAHGKLGVRRAGTAAWIAGYRTAEYLLEHRIPKHVPQLLRALPSSVSSAVLCALIARHAWTFAGSGRLSYVSGSPTRIVITGCPVCAGIKADEAVCTFYAATFERLFSMLVHGRSKVIERECQTLGDPACVFIVDWSG